MTISLLEKLEADNLKTQLMKKIRKFITFTLMGGFMVVLPLLILLALVRWIFKLLSKWLEPLSKSIVQYFALSETLATIVVIVLILFTCFMLGLLVRIQLGKGFHLFLEKNLLNFIPGYTTIRNTLAHFLGNKKAVFSKVALVDIFNNDTRMTGFITDEHMNGYFTVFVPTGPNPTSGNIYHLPKEKIDIVDVPIEEALRSIIGIGAGSKSIVEKSSIALNE